MNKNLHRIVFNRTHSIMKAVSVASLLVVAAAMPAQAVTYYGTYKLSSGTITLSNTAISASATDTSAVWVTSTGNLTINTGTLTTTGSSSSSDSSSFYGLDSGVLATSSGVITLNNCSVTTSGNGANGVFAYGTGSISMTGGSVNCTGQYAHAIMASGGGTLTATNVNMSTAGANSGAIATDRGGGTITVTGGTVTTSGQDSPGIYSTGTITVSNAVISASGSEAAVIEGANSIKLTNTALSSSKTGKWGVLIYQSMSGDASGTTGTFTMTGGTLAYTSTSGPLFYVTNSTGIIKLTGAKVTAASGVLVKAGTGSWGTSGSNGGTVNLTADNETLTGSMTADSLSSITATLQNNTTLTGVVNRAALTVDSSSAWYGMAGSVLNSLSNSGKISSMTAAPGLLTVSGAFTQTSTGTLNIELGGTTAGSTYDKISVTGAATLAGTLNLDLVNGFTPTVGETFDIITCSSQSGTFSALTSSTSGLIYKATYSSSLVELTITAVPEPTAGALMLVAAIMGSVLFGFCRIRRRK
ncbi:MAG: PEP-CTERM sorting domain-containing protein [Thermoguttaceae bacterium]